MIIPTDDNLPWYAKAVITAIMILACFGATNIIIFVTQWLSKLKYCAECKKKLFPKAKD